MKSGTAFGSTTYLPLTLCTLIVLALATPSSAQQYTVTDPGTLPRQYPGSANGINASGQVVGSLRGFPPEVDVFRAFLWSDGVITDLGTLPGYAFGSSASGINASGQVVGSSWSRGPRSVSRAFLWSDGVMTDLNEVIPPDSGWVLGGASAINDAGQIVGAGNHNGQARAFLLTPTK